MLIKHLLTFVVLAHSTKCVENENERTETSKSNSTSVDHNLAERQSYGNFTPNFLECNKVEIAFQNFQLLENQTVFIPGYSSHSHKGLYRPGDYYLSQNGVFVCFLPTMEEEKDYTTVSEEVLEYITVICLLASLVCLLLHFIAFLLVPEMKNLPGKNLASLTVSMFFAHLIFLIGKMGYVKTWSCYPLGLAAYYFTMSSFFWMNSISFNVFRSFRQATTKLRLISKRAELKRFFLYSLYSWVSPAVFLVVVVVGDETSSFPKYLTPGFDSYPHRCWFSQKWSAVLFFVVPFGVLIVFNTAFFIFSAFIIFSNSMKADNQANGWSKKFSLYLKLAVIMGLGWTTGLIASFFPLTPLLIISAVIITLQGVFIFVAFTRFRKTQTSILQRYRRFRKSMASFSTYQTEDLRLSVKKSSVSTVHSSDSTRTKMQQNKPQNGHLQVPQQS